MNEDAYYEMLYKEQSLEIEASSGKKDDSTKTTPKTPKRSDEEVLSWSKFFMCVAFLSKERSEDPNTKVGACIVNAKNKIVAIGHNDLPLACTNHELKSDDFKFDWKERDVTSGWAKTKYPYVCHAAINAILNKHAESLEGCTLYTTLFPGHEDVKLIIQSGIRKVVYYDKKETVYTKIAEDNLKRTKIEICRYPDSTEPGNHKDSKSTEDLKIFPSPNNKSGPEINTDKKNTDPDRDFFMAVAILTSYRSKDPHRQVGACLVNADGKVVGLGYNGLPYGFDDDIISWGKFADGTEPKDVKYPYVVHAEANAIMHKTCIDLKGCTLYVSLFPCNECAKLIIQSGIEKVYFLEGEPQIPPPEGAKKPKHYTTCSRRLFLMAGYEGLLSPETKKEGLERFCRKYVPSREYVIRFEDRSRGQPSGSKRRLQMSPTKSDKKPKISET